MRKLLGTPVLAIVVLLIAEGTASAGYCGVLSYRCGKRACCRQATCTCCRQECHTVMKTCKEVIYEPKEVTAYKTVYEEVIDEKTVDVVKYVEEIRHRYAPTTIMQWKESECCRPAPSCAPVKSCAPVESCQQLVPVQCIQKVPYTALVPVTEQKVEKVPRIVIKQVPYQVTCYCPKVVYKQVPVKVCCPVPCCCKPKCCTPAGCDG